MTNLISFGIIQAAVNKIVEDYKDYGINQSSRAFVFYSVKQIIGDIEDDDILESITDGSHDRGLDAIYFEEEEDKVKIHLFQTKYTERSDRMDNHFEANETNKIFTLLEDILNEIEISNANNIVLEKINLFRSYAKDNKIEKIYIHFCSNTNNGLTPNEEKTFKKRIQNSLGDKCEIIHHSINSLIQEERPKIDKKIKVVDKQFFQIFANKINGCICSVNVVDFLKSIADFSEERGMYLGDNLFEENVRKFLGTQKTKGYNRKIKETALNESENQFFFYYNNGVTIVCDNFDPGVSKISPEIEIFGMQIVNGQQTIRSLFAAYLENPEALEEGNVKILVRIYGTYGDKDIAQKIAEFTNSQNPIRTRDIRSNDDIQKKVEGILKTKGFYYERKSGMFSNEPKEKRIDAEELGQILLAFYHEKPSTNWKKDIFDKFYNLIYHENYIVESSGVDQILFPVLLYRKIVRVREQIRASIRNGDQTELGFVVHASLTILSLIKFEMDKLEDNSFRVDDQTIQKVFDTYYDLMVVKIKKWIEIERAKDPENYSHNNFFKNENYKSYYKNK